MAGGLCLTTEEKIDPNLSMLLSQLMIFGAATQKMIQGSHIHSFAIVWPGLPCKKREAIETFLGTKCNHLLIANWVQEHSTNLDRANVFRYASSGSDELESKQISIQEAPTDIGGCIDFLVKNSTGKSIAICATIDVLPMICLALYKALYDGRKFLRVIPVPIMVPKGSRPVSFALKGLEENNPGLMHDRGEGATPDDIAEVLYLGEV